MTQATDRPPTGSETPPTGWEDPSPADRAPELDPGLDPTQQVEPIEHPEQVWACENSRCRFFNQERRVPLQHLGQGLYLTGSVRCHCGRLAIRVRTGPEARAL